MQKFLEKIFLQKIILFISTFLIIVSIKVYFIFINSIDFGIFTYSANVFMFYNLKSFITSAQSFSDWNHPGTPIYFVYYILNYIFDISHISKFNNFLLLTHIITILLYSFSLYYFYIYFYKIINLRKILIFIFFSFSFYMSIQTLEVADPTNFLYPLSILLLIECDKIFFKRIKITKKILFKLSIISALSLSIKLTFLPFIISIFLPLGIRFIKEKNFKHFFLTIFLLLFFTCLFNLPIIGRLPKILFHVLFIREDTSVELFEINQIVFNIFYFLAEINIFLLAFLFFTFLFFFYSIKKREVKKLSIDKIIFTILITLSFLYTLILATNEIQDFKNSSGMPDLFRNCYIYTVFIIPFFRIINFKSYQINTLLVVAILSFFQNIFFYENLRNKTIKNIRAKNIIFYNKLEENKINLFEDRIAIYSRSGYPFSNEQLHFTANSIFAGEKFDKELLNYFKNLNYLRMHDIIFNFEVKNSKFLKLRDVYEQIDLFLKENLNDTLYLIFSHKSFDITNISLNSPKRSKSLFTKEPKNKIKFIIYNENDRLIRNDKKKKFLKDYFENNELFKIKNKINIRVKEDNWIIYEIF